MKALLELYRQERRKPFAWGTSDCLTWCSDCAIALTGEDPVADVRGTYRDARGAARAIKKLGGSFGSAVVTHLPEIPPALAQSGDWAIVTNEDGEEVLGVIVGALVYARGKTGLALCSRSRVKRAFKVMG